MRLNSEDRAVLDHIARDGGLIVDRAVDWCAINSGSRHLAGLERQRQILLDLAAEHGYGVPAFNINNMEQALAIMAAADATH